MLAGADEAARQTGDVALQAQAGLQLARAANAWARPLWALQAGRRAEELFLQAGDAPLAAAARWQQNALPWCRPDFAQAAEILGQALGELEAAGLDELAADCRLSWAFARLLTGNYEGAGQAARRSEEYFAGRPAGLEADLGRCRCLLTRSSALRRQGQVGPARDCLEAAMAAAEAHDAPVLVAQIEFQFGYLDYVGAGRLEQAESHWQRASRLFAAANMPLWVAQVRKAMAEVQYYRGDFAAMGAGLLEARRVFEEHEVLGMLADTLLEVARWEMARGEYRRALVHLQQEWELHDRLGATFMLGVGELNQGQANAQLGRYQLALRDFERAMARFEQLGNPQRQAEAEWNLGGLWLHLGRPGQALAHLDQVEALYREAALDTLPFNTLNLKARALLAEERYEDALRLLRDSLAEAERLGAMAQAGLACRLLADLLLSRGELQEARRCLSRAEELFAGSGLLHEEAATLISVGHCSLHAGDPPAARAAWQQALALSDGLLPEITLQANAGLARLEVEPAGKLELYRRGVAAMAEMRRDFRQPELADSFFSGRAGLLEQAVRLAVELERGEDALALIEEGKGQLLARAISGEAAGGALPASEELLNLRAEMDLLQEQLRAMGMERDLRRRSEELARLRGRLRQRAGQYAALRGRLARAAWDGAEEARPEGFQRERLAAALDGHLGGALWLGLDYFLTPDEIFVALVDGDGCRVVRRARTARLNVALEQLGRAAAPHGPDLRVLGELLLPPEVRERLRPDMLLIIAPHRELHRLPWVGLLLPDSGQALATVATPVIAPSMQALSMLLRRDERAAKESEAGLREQLLAVCVAEFASRWPALPAVRAEAARLEAMFGRKCRQLLDDDATAAGLLAAAGSSGLGGSYGILHIATHVYFEHLTGVLSGIALHDHDWLLDEIWELAPLPGLVTLSACSGSRSRVYAGDEQVSLVDTCLAAGANQVVGALWPVRDEAAARLMAHFYASYLEGAPAATSLAMAQRAAAQRGDPPADWAGFRCSGLP